MRVRLVHLEDDETDRELVARTLRAEGIDCAVVEAVCREDFERALDDPPDLILSDYSMPGFGGDEAQDIAQSRCPDVPFLFLSGSIGEERAVERLKNGATDYVLKNRLDKLGPAVRRAMREAEDRRRRAAAEAELRQLNTQLEARVEERTRAVVAANMELQQARHEADRANRAKSEFLSRMSHDLRTPLNAIMGFAQLLNLDDLAPDQVDSVNHILRGGEHLLSLINEVLDIARIESGHLTLSPEPVSVAEAVEHAIDLIRPMAAKRQIAITSDIPAQVYVFADRQRLSQILLNLLSNAVKYNREGGSASVRAAYDRGTVFDVRLPAAEAGGPPIDAPAQPVTASARYTGTILYIEDNVSNVVLMERLLARRPGVRLTHAVDGATGLRMLKAGLPDLVILDLHLSDMSGEEVLRRIWSDRATRHVPVAVLSADATSHSQRRLRASGAVAYLTKPFDIAEVLRLIDEIVGGVRVDR